MYSKSDILRTLNQMSRIMREVKNLDAETKRLISVNAGCLVSEVDDVEGNLDQVIEHINDLMVDKDDIGDLDIDANFTAISEVLETIDKLDERHQIILIESIFKSEVFDTNVEGLNDLFKDCDRPFYVLHIDEASSIKDLLEQA